MSSSCVSQTLFAGVSLLIAVLLQGCNFIKMHDTGFWLQKTNYIDKFSYVTPSGNTTLNSCADSGIPDSLKCNGRGSCKAWSSEAMPSQVLKPRLSFCQCDKQYAGPECETVRKSNLLAFMLSAFFGMFGVDQFYLGYMGLGVGKLLSFGGLGTWYIYDIVRIGSSPVYASGNYRCADDLPHWVFVLVAISLMTCIGLAFGIYCIKKHKYQKARDLLILNLDEEDGKPFGQSFARKFTPAPVHMTPGYTQSRFDGYSTMRTTVSIN